MRKLAREIKVDNEPRKKMPLCFFKPGEKVDTKVYYKVLRYKVLLWLKPNHHTGNYVWTQDGAPAHTARQVQKFCNDNFADFWPANFWPSSSPDLNPLDYAIRAHCSTQPTVVLPI